MEYTEGFLLFYCGYIIILKLIQIIYLPTFFSVLSMPGSGQSYDCLIASEATTRDVGKMTII